MSALVSQTRRLSLQHKHEQRAEVLLNVVLPTSRADLQSAACPADGQFVITGGTINCASTGWRHALHAAANRQLLQECLLKILLLLHLPSFCQIWGWLGLCALCFEELWFSNDTIPLPGLIGNCVADATVGQEPEAKLNCGT